MYGLEKGMFRRVRYELEKDASVIALINRAKAVGLTCDMEALEHGTICFKDTSGDYWKFFDFDVLDEHLKELEARAA